MGRPAKFKKIRGTTLKFVKPMYMSAYIYIYIYVRVCVYGTINGSEHNEHMNTKYNYRIWDCYRVATTSNSRDCPPYSGVIGDIIPSPPHPLGRGRSRV